MTFADRLRAEVDYRHAGSVTRAAAAVGISQPSMRALVSGAAAPRTSTLQKVAAVYGGSLNWWLDGNGSAPVRDAADEFEPWDELLAWAELQDRLNLPSMAAEALEFLPYGVRTVSVSLPRGGEADDRLIRFMRETLRLSLRTWLAWVNGLIDMYGIDEVRAELTKAAPVAALGFTWPALHLIEQGVVPLGQIEKILLPGEARRRALAKASRVEMILSAQASRREERLRLTPKRATRKQR